jgi:hypothetical protein
MAHLLKENAKTALSEVAVPDLIDSFEGALDAEVIGGL